MALRLPDFSHLTRDERIELAERLWDVFPLIRSALTKLRSPRFVAGVPRSKPTVTPYTLGAVGACVRGGRGSSAAVSPRRSQSRFS
jgi:hypothetical protein